MFLVAVTLPVIWTIQGATGTSILGVAYTDWCIEIAKITWIWAQGIFVMF